MKWPDTGGGVLVLTPGRTVDGGALVVAVVAVDGGALAVMVVDGGGDGVLGELAEVQAASATAAVMHSAAM